MVATRRNKRRNRSNPNGGSALRFYTPQQFEDAKVRNPDVFHPTVQMPSFMLSWFQAHIRTNASYPGANDGEQIAGRHFGDGERVWPVLRTVWGLFNFRNRDKSDRINLINSILLGVIYILATVMGSRENAFRYWCSIFDSAFTGLRVEFPEGSEPTAVLRYTDEFDPGWDEYFPDYGYYAEQALERAVDNEKAARYWQQAANLPETAYPKIVMREFLRLRNHYGEDAGDEPATGDIYDSMAYKIARANANGLLNGITDDDIDRTMEPRLAAHRSLFGPSSTLDLKTARAYGDTVRARLTEPLGTRPAWPIEGEDITQMSRLVPIQRYGFIRSGGRPHRGLDLPAKQGTNVIAMYGGTVVRAVSDWKKGGSPRGNYVVIVSKFANERDALLHEYYHLEKTNLKPGDRVMAGDVIGTVGSTGNSTGPHVHLTTRLTQRDPGGDRTIKRVTINPEKVLLEGAARAATAEGYSFGDPEKPHLGLPLYILQTVSGGHYMQASPSYVADEYARALKTVFGDTEQESEQVNPPSGGLDDQQRKEIKTQTKKILVKIAPDAVGFGLQTALLAVGVPPVVSTMAAKTVSDIIRSRQVGASGAPEVADVMAQTRARAHKILGDMTLDEAGDFLPHIEQYLNEYWQKHNQ